MNGHCARTVLDGYLHTCVEPTTSVLCDGVIPTLSDFSGHTWASQLLTVAYGLGISVDGIWFELGYNGVTKLEVVLFSCPEWGISSDLNIQIVVRELSGLKNIASKHVDLTSCESLVRVCIPVHTQNPNINLRFFGGLGIKWLHLWLSMATPTPPVPLTSL